VFHLLTKLEELDLYDNKIKDVGDALDKLSDLSYVTLVLTMTLFIYSIIGYWTFRSIY
jgi:protein phosphatase 1 regulatory subunit 7